MVTTGGEVYSHGHHESVLRSHRWRTAENSAAYLLPRLRPTDHVLDVGCGPGTITLDLASRVTEGRVTGVDSAAVAVETAQRQAVESGSLRVEFEIGDVYDLRYADDSFDVVHAHQVLQHLSDPVAALRSLRRVCRPGGLVAVRDADYGAMTWFPPHPGLHRWLTLYQRVARANGGEPDAGRRLRSWASAAGFSQLQAGASVWCFTDPADVAWWSDSWAQRVRLSAFAEQARAHGLADEAELDGLAQAWREWGAAPDAWFTVLHGEVLATA